ncbi:class Ib ribonucleoside-diphosphate reductase assembly flavoprotein NrdI [Mycoplasmoides pneumoniae]|uniref:Protein NrdI n=1 Tax=Mycoplasma pneumoniae (strain ATCC 29342 / M129 / Subtype 1) TaxID=272634 RepID=NRDI_MYCPN|nr:class Ib ribonucleoside-diphosphate reductase assembly flavoprotein NrdI [Mycoplasmoides pneumoniae]P75460.1 RecName: Full=Protein NrdI [Mycoplasmoides pneumoniae M129]AAB96161.1 probably nrdI [Mycoplasmoides pneumoniae M129]AGC04242.1 ribonucleotide reductase [Mycoplasmoides pneumoniae M129-B7]ALA30204.1 ribonucleotide reductase [Mycoplasmoides pneumoniae PI 1428]ALA32314.1 ribonucleotide reductase [Mycoplasmoides pneumoniae 51494]ALA33015.1 ribonucleotide reductase [Mycoplasmoides pneumo
MHKDIKIVDASAIVKPTGTPYVVYFSSISNNTHRFIEKLEFEHTRIPVNLDEQIEVNQEYVLFCPTYSGGGEYTSGAVPKQVIHFLNNKHNRDLCRGVISSGNTNFGNTFAIAGPILSKKLNVPLLYQFELLGTKNDVEQVQTIITNFFGKAK